jgi:hypothetical protein
MLGNLFKKELIFAFIERILSISSNLTVVFEKIIRGAVEMST